MAQRKFWFAFLLAMGCSLLGGPAVFAAERQLQIAPVKPAAGERRLALVIGNSSYKSSPLRNPVNDARAIAKALANTGFAVTVIEDATQTTMRRAMRTFGDELSRGGVGLFYYAGHGMQVGGKNYLIPVNADIEREDEVEDQAVDANLILAKMDTAKNALNLMILDACRNNPFARSFRSSAQGLAQMDAPSGTLVAFATAPGSVASDGDGDNGLYTKHLLANLSRPGLPIEQLFKEVRIGVTRDTKDRQVPWESSSLRGNFSFIPGEATLSAEDQRRQIERTVAERVAEQQKQMERMVQEMLARQRAALEAELKNQKDAALATAKPAAVAAPSVVDRSQMELAFWDSIKNSSNPQDYKAYLEQYPQGSFASLARSRAIAPAAPVVASAAPAEAPKPAAAIAALKPVEPAKPAPLQVASTAPTALIGTGIDDPRYPKIGDLWEYEFRNHTTRRSTLAQVEISAVTKNGIIDATRPAGGAVIPRAHSPAAALAFIGRDDLQFSPYLLSFGTPKSGETWKGLEAQDALICREQGVYCSFDAKVLGNEKITTRAGTFDSLKVLVELNGGRAGGLFRIWRQYTYWYAIAAKRVVKVEHRNRGTTTGKSDLADNYDIELVSYKLN